jgi:hypothetical protein
MIKIAIWSAMVVTAVVGLGSLFHRICTRLEDAGYVYYRKEKGGGGGVSGALSELDKLTRPSIQHVIEVEDTAKIERDDVGDGEWPSN